MENNQTMKDLTAKEKAKELVEQFYGIGLMDYHEARQCALIAVDEIIEVIKELNYGVLYLTLRDYYLDVKSEIEKL